MDLPRIILGPVLTEKAERLKTRRTHVLRVHPAATKVDIVHALERYFGVQVQGVRIQRVRPKTRLLKAGRMMTKRHAMRRALVTLREGSPALDLANFQSS